MSGDGRWLTYEELAKLRGITKASAERLVFRNHWRRQRGNDRTVRVLVPLDSLSGDTSPDESPDISPDTTELLAGALTALEDAVGALRSQLDAANARAERAETERGEERRRADDLRSQITVLNAEMTATRAGLERGLEDARRETREARDAVQRLEQEEVERKARGRLRRAWEAWRGA
jgi:outer membrane murein-binding lipoprotein Lpp